MKTPHILKCLTDTAEKRLTAMGFFILYARAAISDRGLQVGIKLKQIRICLLEEIESFLHVMPPLLKGDRLSHTLYVANSSFQANQRVCAVLPKQQQKNPHDFFFQKGEQKKQTLFKPRDRALHTLRRLCCPRVWQIVMMCVWYVGVAALTESEKVGVVDSLESVEEQA